MIRLAEFRSLMAFHPIDLAAFREECRQRGCPDTEGIRARAWRLLLGYLPDEPTRWAAVTQKARADYASLAVDFISEMGGRNATTGDHPLNSEPGSNWQEFFADNEVLLQINKDCRRLYPEFDFFRRPTGYPCHSLLSPRLSVNAIRERMQSGMLRSQEITTCISGAKCISRNDEMVGPSDRAANLTDNGGSYAAKTAYSDIDEDINYCPIGHNEEAHWEVIRRILFVYYRVNRRSSYVQGMNEIVAPLYYVFATDPDSSWRKYSEPDTFYCFNALMAEIQNNFMQRFDKSIGIGGKIDALMNLVNEFDPELLQHLINLQIEPVIFAFRWITLLLTREFHLPDLLRLWDSILADENRFTLVLYISCSMLMLVKDKLLNCDFASAVRLLQDYPSVDVGVLLRHAEDLYARHHPN